MSACASARLTNQCSFRHSSRNLPLKLSTIGVLDRLARSNEAQRARRARRPRRRARGRCKFGAVVHDDGRGQADRLGAVGRARATTRSPGSDRSTSMATHSRVKSSTMFSVRKARPSASVSTMKSIDQRSPRLARRRQRHALAARQSLPATPPHLQTRRSVEPIHAFVIDVQAFAIDAAMCSRR